MIRRVLPAIVLGAAVLCLGGCSEMSAMEPEGPRADTIANVWWFLLAVGGAVWVIVVVFLFAALFRRRRDPVERGARSEPVGLLLIIGAIIPGIVLIGVMGVTVAALSSLGDPDDDEDALVVEVIGHRWWWEVNYPQHGFTTANEIHIPTGEPVRFDFTSADVIHSFWVPQLHGKMDLFPDQVTTMWIEAREPGRYIGQCAEFCGLQHANMQVFVTAEEPSDFDAWVAGQQEPAPQPTDEVLIEGEQVFLGSACVYCHAIEGTGASGRLGPDLTHLASRETLAAGTLENNRGNLAGWIIDPQSLKPGNLMPGTDLDGPSLQALLAYLESLE